MWILIISLLVIGLVLLIVEVIFIPGTTVVGVLGLIFTVAGVVITYKHFGNDVGFYVLLGTMAFTGVMLFYSFKSGAWERYSLKGSIKSKVNEGMIEKVKVGDTGTTLSSLRPSGKAEFDEQVFEVRTLGEYVGPGTKISVVAVHNNQIIVEALKDKNEA